MMIQPIKALASSVDSHFPVCRLFPRDLVKVSFISKMKEKDVLYPEERIYINNAVNKRIQEFSTGRYCARRAMKRANVKSQAIPMRKDGCPIWPTGVVGSITHTRNYVAAAVGQNNKIDAIGIDVERIDPTISESVWSIVCSPEELQIIKQQPIDQRNRYAFALFSAKESTAKCIYSKYGVKKGLIDIPITLNLRHGTFSTLSDRSEHHHWQGRIEIDKNFIYSGLWLPAGTFSIKH